MQYNLLLEILLWSKLFENTFLNKLSFGYKTSYSTLAILHEINRNANIFHKEEDFVRGEYPNIQEEQKS